MNYKAVLNSSIFLKSIFVISVFVLIFISAASYKHSEALAGSSDLVVHSYKVHLELDHLFSYLRDAETEEREFIILRDSSYVQLFNVARDKVSKSLSTIIMLIGEKPQQKRNMDSLDQMINMRLVLLVNSMEQGKNGETKNDVLNNNLLKGKALMDSIQNQITKMIEFETAYLFEKQIKNKYEILFTPFFILMLMLFSILIFCISYIKINNDFEKLKVSNENLIISSESIKHAEEIGDFSTWQWELESDKLIYSDNQYRILGCEPQSFEPSLEKYLEFVHPADRHFFTEDNKAVGKDNEPSIIFYRIIRKDGALRYFKSIGKLLTDIKGKKIVIGINCDITEQHLSNIALKERNLELEQSNKELASFNHIASHDLQEPLRKVQTFISRISDKEIDSISEAGREYFERILHAVGRMRVLIDDLLLFSRTNKVEKVFEIADLNSLLENAKMELAQTIEEKKAVIQSVRLPSLIVIPFQIQQLFINLIGNSLKYSRIDVKPEIRIFCEKINSRNNPLLNSNLYPEYYRIAISDNGMGFEQQYSEHLFNLFYRLHHPEDYPGSGIGLSICKKIVENHAGIIEAIGKPGEGSTFSFYLPIQS